MSEMQTQRVSYIEEAKEDVSRDKDRRNRQVAQGREDLEGQKGEVDVGGVLKVNGVGEGQRGCKMETMLLSLSASLEERTMYS